MRSFWSSFCIHGKRNSLANGSSFAPTDNDVSHLATPHISLPSLTLHNNTNNANQQQPSPAPRRSVNSTPNGASVELAVPSGSISNHGDQNHRPSFADNNNNKRLSRSGEVLDVQSARNSPVISAPTVQVEYNNSHPSSPSSNSPALSNSPETSSQNQHQYQYHHNHHHQHQSNQSSLAQASNEQSSSLSRPYQNNFENLSHQNNQNQNNIQQRPILIQMNENSSGIREKLSYDIISVREPLAKVLAERQQIQQAQQIQRQIIGDHEYIEVYGERGSSCFYEEIAGSATSSVTYDQIGNNSNHNYQVLMNADALLNQPSIQDVNRVSSNEGSHYNHISSISNRDENVYDATDAATHHSNGNQTDHPENQASSSASCFSPSNISSLALNQNALIVYASIANDDTTSQSVPVYSVINKATRKSTLVSSNLDHCRPPKPPPKNVSMVMKQASPNAIHQKDVQDQQHALNSRNNGLSHIPSTSSYLQDVTNNINHNDTNHKDKDGRHNSETPQPPPRLSKQQSTFNATNRPLPLPEQYDLNDNMRGLLDRNSYSNEDDNDCSSNGYELLGPNWDDDTMDVGYEKIRESNRYSGGSLSSQIRNLQAIENGGYESVQPIYSSPSNDIVDPNYEAINPATASEIAAAATARLNAAATVFEKILKQENQ